MSVENSEFFNNVLLPKVYNDLDSVFPEFEFQKKGNHWISGNKLKVTGEIGDKVGAVYVYENSPYCFKDWTREAVGLIAYLKNKGEVSNTTEALKLLSKKVNVSFPQELNNSNDLLLEDLNRLLVNQLKSSEEALSYLENRKLKNLKGVGFTGDLSELRRLYKNIKIFPKGSDNRISIPYRDELGRLVGFSFRDIKDSSQKKYINSHGLSRSKYLFNYKANKSIEELIIVEGYLCALHADLKELDNVVALGGVNISTEQIDIIKKSKVKRVILLMDNDTVGKEASIKIGSELVENLSIPIYIAFTDNQIKDLDQLLREEGIEGYSRIISKSKSYLTFEAEEYLSSVKNESEIDRDSLLERLKVFFLRVDSPFQKEELINLFSKKLDIPKKELVDYLDSFRKKVSKEEANRVKRSLDKGEFEKAHDILSNICKQSNINNLSVTQLLEPYTEKQFLKDIELKSEGLFSGYYLDEKKENKLELPTGAITVIAGPTSHGKTSALINTALNLTKEVSSPVHFFSFEESKAAVTLKAFNTFFGEDISNNNKRSIETYFRTGSKEYFSKEFQDRLPRLYQARENFFNEVMKDKLRVHYQRYYVEDLVEVIKEVHQKEKTEVVLIDYMQLLNSKSKERSRQEELKSVCIMLKDLAIETGLAIVLGAQFNRTVVSADTIHLTAIGEAGDIERIANLIIGIWNGNFPDKDKESSDVGQGKILFKVLKGRDIGAGHQVRLDFMGNTGKIANEVPKEIESPF